MVPHAADILLPHAQKLRQAADHAALVGSPGGDLQQVHGGGHHLVLPAPVLGPDGLLQLPQPLGLLLEQQLGNR